MLLAIDTATQTISIALHDGQRLLAEHTWPTGVQHSVQLAPAIQQLLMRAEQRLADITIIGVCTGPGSYSGLRVGIATAKGLAAVRRLPLVGVGALDVLAAGQPHVPETLIVAVGAGRSRAVVGRYQWRKSRWHKRGEPTLMDWATLLRSVDGPAHLTGEIPDSALEQMAAAQAGGLPLTLMAAPYRLRRAGFLAQEAWDRFRAGKEDEFDPARLTPLYVKTPDAP